MGKVTGVSPPPSPLSTNHIKKPLDLPPGGHIRNAAIEPDLNEGITTSEY